MSGHLAFPGSMLERAGLGRQRTASGRSVVEILASPPSAAPGLLAQALLRITNAQAILEANGLPDDEARLDALAVLRGVS